MANAPQSVLHVKRYLSMRVWNIMGNQEGGLRKRFALLGRALPNSFSVGTKELAELAHLDFYSLPEDVQNLLAKAYDLRIAGFPPELLVRLKLVHARHPKAELFCLKSLPGVPAGADGV